MQVCRTVNVIFYSVCIALYSDFVHRASLYKIKDQHDPRFRNNVFFQFTEIQICDSMQYKKKIKPDARMHTSRYFSVEYNYGNVM